jgi:hypothetical protein
MNQWEEETVTCIPTAEQEYNSVVAEVISKVVEVHCFEFHGCIQEDFKRKHRPSLTYSAAVGSLFRKYRCAGEHWT